MKPNATRINPDQAKDLRAALGGVFGPILTAFKKKKPEAIVDQVVDLAPVKAAPFVESQPLDSHKPQIARPKTRRVNRVESPRLTLTLDPAIATAIREETMRYCHEKGNKKTPPQNYLSVMCAEIFDRHLRKRGWRKTEDGAYVLKDAEGPNDAGGTA